MVRKKKESEYRRFPTFAVVLLVIGLVWLLNDLNVISVDVPWIPLVIVVVAAGMIFNRFSGTCCT